MKTINSFRGDFAFLSNFFVGAPFAGVGRYKWKTSEHFYQSCKTRNEKERILIMEASTPGEAKKIGREIEMIDNWDEIKTGVMRDALRMKFDQWPKYKKYLIQTEKYELIEGNWWHDNFWGNCFCDKCENKPGTNMLGLLLMKLRDYYIEMEKE